MLSLVRGNLMKIWLIKRFRKFWFKEYSAALYEREQANIRTIRAQERIRALEIMLKEEQDKLLK